MSMLVRVVESRNGGKEGLFISNIKVVARNREQNAVPDVVRFQPWSRSRATYQNVLL